MGEVESLNLHNLHLCKGRTSFIGIRLIAETVPYKKSNTTDSHPSMLLNFKYTLVDYFSTELPVLGQKKVAEHQLIPSSFPSASQTEGILNPRESLKLHKHIAQPHIGWRSYQYLCIYFRLLDDDNGGTVGFPEIQKVRIKLY